MSHLRYVRGTRNAERFGSIRYPAHAEVSAEQAELMRAAMPEPDAFEIVGDED